jgi:phosphosulfolactate synthase
MKNFELPYLPVREEKPRETGLTMMMDKGLSLAEAEQFISSSSEFTDLVKFGFGTAMITPNLKEKINIYRQAGIRPYLGGTLFELFVIRDLFEDFRRLVDELDIDLIEVSDGSMRLDHERKLDYIRTLSKQVTVLSEVGSKQASVEIPMDVWVMQMKSELDAGSWKVIAEARESGNIGIYNSDGSARLDLIRDITESIPNHKVLWEAPVKSQQAYFIKLLGANVNLGNIAPFDVISLESLRLGLRGDTFYEFLPEDLNA